MSSLKFFVLYVRHVLHERAICCNPHDLWNRDSHITMQLRYEHTSCHKVKQSHYRPGQSLRVPRVLHSQISRQSAHEGGKLVSLTHRPPLPFRKYTWYLFLLEAESTPGHQGAVGRIVSMKNSSDTIGNRTCDLPVCGALPQPTAPPAACPLWRGRVQNIFARPYSLVKNVTVIKCQSIEVLSFFFCRLYRC